MAPADMDTQRAMRILLITTGLKVGGAEHQVVALARAFLALGHAVAILSLSPGREIDIPAGVEVFELNMRKTPGGMAAALAQARALVKAWRPDVMHAHMVHANLFGRLLTRLVDSPPLVCTAHSFREGGSMRMLAYRLTDRWAALTTHVSQDGRAGMIAAGGVRDDRIVVMPNGIDVERFRPDPALRDATRARLGIAPDARVVLNVGRLAPEKAQDLLIRAFGQLPPAVPAHLLIAGGGALVEALASQIVAQGLTSSVTLLGPRDDIPAMLNAADLFVLSSNIEGLPMVLVEALACGCPVVSTDAPGVAEVLRDQGVIVPRGDAAALAGAMAEALRAGRGTPAQAAARRERVLSAFSIDSIARRWLAHYASLTHGARANPAETA
ncbi:Glycosyltransferase involved in cell wall bisynthesis [Cupriavidus sp. OV038]|uniref:glycosyltransferase n=1 Tax=unclassified Cupriavidus TaxID=2640874 RepID=UPI0008F2923C|nr:MULTISPECIES: glycosyltransferase [unclassified Cupriavidus]SFB78499.1 Glycosyltransferase involved in cell wall bisynthesis [Cupriavidus sp. OV038]SFO65567.1 Glycosyltransferase involved in cell wall bisynthesis [Cupriavidus sp. OV096]